jgi:O-antigen ligase
MVLLVGGRVAIAVMPDSTLGRFESLDTELTIGTFTNRKEIWRVASELFQDNMVVGAGVGSFGRAMGDAVNWSMVAHNTFISVAVELGIVGLVLYVVPIGFALLAARRLPEDERWLVWGAFAAWTVGVMSLSWEHQKVSWFLLVMSAQFALLRQGDAPLA